jgi:hypothetical protein
MPLKILLWHKAENFSGGGDDNDDDKFVPVSFTSETGHYTFC